MFVRGSRYEAVPDALHVTADGREQPYKRLRLLPSPPSLQRHTVARGERLDHIAFRYFRDPEQFWRVCDANAAMLPRALTAEPGRVLHIPFAQG